MDGSPPIAVLNDSRVRHPLTVRSPVVEDYILSELTLGHTLSQICRELGISRQLVHLWRKADAKFDERYQEAKELGWDAIADEIIEIVDTERDPKRARVRADARERMLARWANGSYANTLKVESKNMNLNAEIAANPVEAARQYQQLMGDG